MAVTLADIVDIMEKKAPRELKESYDNVGLMVGNRQSKISRVLIALDCTLEVIDEAINKKAELIITHHPLLFKKPASITTDTLQGSKIIKLISNNINLYSSHTNLDSVCGGMNDTIMDMLGIQNSSTLEPIASFEGYQGAIGRIGNIDRVSLKKFISHIKAQLNIKNLRYTGDINGEIERVAVINGSGQDYISIAFNEGAQCIITGDTTYHYASDYEELGCSIIDIGHFSSEWLVFVNLMKKIVKDNSEFFEGTEIIISECCRDPYIFL